jgi:predicted adenine nucleotide alpha hydrolase (AANH) superfamily ATPase
VAAFFYNPNIHPENEYHVREKEIRSYMRQVNISYLAGPYDVNEWADAVKGFENEPEGGQRCDICYRIRLKRTAFMAKYQGFDCFTTTLSISPHKKADCINCIGNEMGKMFNIPYIEADFKKKDGFRISCEMSRNAGIYRQNYCGCMYSRRDAVQRSRRS